MITKCFNFYLKRGEISQNPRDNTNDLGSLHNRLSVDTISEGQSVSTTIDNYLNLGNPDDDSEIGAASSVI